MFRFFHFLWWMETSVFPTPPRKFWKLSLPYLGRKVMTKLDSIFKSRDITLPTKVHLVKAMVFPVVMYGMWELDCEESWAPKNWCFWIVVLEKTLESPLNCKEIQPVHPKGDQSWMFIGRTDTKAETPILWPPHVKSWLIGKNPDPGRDWGQEQKLMAEDEMAGWHHWLDGHEFEWTLGVSDGQWGLACCDSWGRKETQLSDWTDFLTDWYSYSYCHFLNCLGFAFVYVVLQCVSCLYKYL